MLKVKSNSRQGAVIYPSTGSHQVPTGNSPISLLLALGGEPRAISQNTSFLHKPMEPLVSTAVHAPASLISEPGVSKCLGHPPAAACDLPSKAIPAKVYRKAKCCYLSILNGSQHESDCGEAPSSHQH